MVLSLDFDPVSFHPRRDGTIGGILPPEGTALWPAPLRAIPLMSDEDRRRIDELFWLAGNHAPDSLVINEPDKFHISQSVVRLPDYAAWFERIGFVLPDEFPGRSTPSGQPQLDPRKRKTYLKVIAALASAAKVDVDRPYAEAPSIVVGAKELGLTTTDNTVAEVLSEVAALIKGIPKPQ